MAEVSEPLFAVSAYSDPVVMRINGRASYLNSAPASDFFEHMLGRGKRHFVLDFHDCTGVDSTFLGIIAGVALQLREPESKGSMILCRLSRRNLELVRNLGLHRIITVDSGRFAMEFEEPAEHLDEVDHTEIENARMILSAHENLVEADESNRAKFQDVIAFLKNQADSTA